MATVTKDFKVKAGLIVEGTNGTINGSDIITEDIITGGTQTNIAVTYNPGTKTLDFVAENGVSDSTTDDLAEGSSNLYFTDARAKDSAAALLTTATLTNISITGTGNGGLTITAENGVADSTTSDLVEGTNLYFTDERAQDAVATAITNGTQNGISVTYDDSSNAISFNVNDPTITISGDVDGSATMTNLGNTDIAVTLDTVNANVGTFGSTTQIPSITVDGKGRVTAVSTNSVATNLSIAGDSGTDTVDLLSDSLTVSGGTGITTTVTNNTVSVDIDSTVATLTGTQTLSNKTLGSTLDANSNTISNLADPVQPQDAATKSYVDTVAAEGLHVQDGADVGTTATLAVISGGTVTYDNGTAGVGATLTTTGSFATIDGVDLSTFTEPIRVLVKDEVNQAHNGIYILANSTSLVMTRDTLFDSDPEIQGGDFVFVVNGTVNGGTGWVQTATVDVVGTDAIDWAQFSGAGTYVAGYGLTLTGNTFAVDNTEIASQGNLATAVSDLTDYVDGFLNSVDGTTVQYIDAQDAATLLSANGYSDALVATGDAAATPQYLAINVNDIAKQVAATTGAFATLPAVVYSWPKAQYRSAEFLVKVSYGTHTEISKILLTLDTADNIAITEYAVVGTNGSLSAISATVVSNDVQILVTPGNDSTVNVVGTLLV